MLASALAFCDLATCLSHVQTLEIEYYKNFKYSHVMDPHQVNIDHSKHVAIYILEHLLAHILEYILK